MTTFDYVRPVTLADVRKALDNGDDADAWLWRGYAYRGQLNEVTADPKVGKSVTVLDLAARFYKRHRLPGGIDNPLPAGMKTIWCLGDRQHRQVADRWAAAGLPDDALLTSASPDAVLGGYRLDDHDNLQRLCRLVMQERESLAFFCVDTAWSCAPSKKMHDTGDVGEYLGMLAELALESGVTGFILNHLNREGGSLGRRADGICRSILKLSRVDPDDRSKLRLDADGNGLMGPPLALTITETGVEYSADPPAASASPDDQRGRGRPPTAIVRATSFLVRELSRGDRKAGDLVEKWEARGEEKRTLFNALGILKDTGELVVDDTSKPKLWHLVADPTSAP